MINTSEDLDTTVLDKIAVMTGGKYFRAQNSSDLKKVYESIDKLEPIESNKTVVRPVTYLYPWSLWFSIDFEFYDGSYMVKTQEMIKMTFHFLRPWWFLAIVPAVIFVILLLKHLSQANGWAKYCDSHLLEHILVGQQSAPKKITYTIGTFVYLGCRYL